MTRFALALALLATPSVAFAQDKAACVSAYEQGQLDRRNGHFDAARVNFATCTADGCPSVVRERCVDFARDLESAQPTVIVVVRDASGHDVAGASVSIDGAPPTPIPAASLRLDPGEHVVRVEAHEGTAAQHIVLREGEKERRIEVDIGEKPIVAPPPKVVVVRDKPIAAWAMTVVAGVGLVSAGALSGTGWGIYADLSSTCKQACSDDQVAPLHVLWPAAFVALGVGTVALIVAAVLYGTHSSHHESAALRIGPNGVAGVF